MNIEDLHLKDDDAAWIGPLKKYISALQDEVFELKGEVQDLEREVSDLEDHSDAEERAETAETELEELQHRAGPYMDLAGWIRDDGIAPAIHKLLEEALQKCEQRHGVGSVEASAMRDILSITKP